MNIAYRLYIKSLKKLFDELNSKSQNLKILDLGCGNINSSPVLDSCKHFKKYVGVDGFHFKKINNNSKIKLYKMDIFDIDKHYKKSYFDIVLALDVIEHLTVPDGHRLITLMEKMSKNTIVILTPNGFIKQYDRINKLNNHISGWKYSFFEKNNYKIEGIYGPKIFRKEFCELRKPKYLFGVLSLFCNILFTRRFPKFDMSLLCVKKMN
jgi:hypothetical protein